jgi:hypothetical protein
VDSVMRKTSSVLTLKAALIRERRTNERLRTIIEELREQGCVNRRELDLQFTRLAQIQAQLDRLTGTKGPEERRPIAENRSDTIEPGPHESRFGARSRHARPGQS